MVVGVRGCGGRKYRSAAARGWLAEGSLSRGWGKRGKPLVFGGRGWVAGGGWRFVLRPD